MASLATGIRDCTSMSEEELEAATDYLRKLHVFAASETGQYIIEGGGDPHANARGKVDPALVERYGLDHLQRLFQDSLLTVAPPPVIGAKMIEEFERIRSEF